ncbi:MAG: methyltransferase domain-containing protein [Thermoplasmata archaeon]
MPANPRRGSRPRKRPASRSSERRRRIRERFDTQVDRERRRYSGQAWRLLVRELRDRFLERYLPQGHGWVLELGPGPGRFTPTILSSGARVVAVDLSLPMLRALGRRKPIRSRSTRLRRVRAAGEHLPFQDGTFRAAIALGNILGFSASDGARLLSELARVTRPGGLLILDVASPVAATTDFLESAARTRLLRRVLRDPSYYFLNQVAASSDRTHQPYAPKRWGFFEFDFYTPAGAEEALVAAGFRPVDRMALGAVGAYRERLTTIARREPRVWRNLLELEERVGRRSGVLETGHGFVVAAVRERRSPRTRPQARPQESYRPPRSRAAHVLS